MVNALELLTTRRSFKAVELSGPAPSAAEIDTLLTVAARVPDHGKLAPWRFIVFEGEAREGPPEMRSRPHSRANIPTRNRSMSRRNVIGSPAHPWS